MRYPSAVAAGPSTIEEDKNTSAGVVAASDNNNNPSTTSSPPSTTLKVAIQSTSSSSRTLSPPPLQLAIEDEDSSARSSRSSSTARAGNGKFGTSSSSSLLSSSSNSRFRVDPASHEEEEAVEGSNSSSGSNSTVEVVVPAGAATTATVDKNTILHHNDNQQQLQQQSAILDTIDRSRLVPNEYNRRGHLGSIKIDSTSPSHSVMMQDSMMSPQNSADSPTNGATSQQQTQQLPQPPTPPSVRDLSPSSQQQQQQQQRSSRAGGSSRRARRHNSDEIPRIVQQASPNPYGYQPHQQPMVQPFSQHHHQYYHAVNPPLPPGYSPRQTTMHHYPPPNGGHQHPVHGVSSPHVNMNGASPYNMNGGNDHIPIWPNGGVDAGSGTPLMARAGGMMAGAIPPPHLSASASDSYYVGPDGTALPISNETNYLLHQHVRNQQSQLSHSERHSERHYRPRRKGRGHRKSHSTSEAIASYGSVLPGGDAGVVEPPTTRSHPPSINARNTFSNGADPQFSPRNEFMTLAQTLRPQGEMSPRNGSYRKYAQMGEMSPRGAMSPRGSMSKKYPLLPPPPPPPGSAVAAANGGGGTMNNGTRVTWSPYVSTTAILPTPDPALGSLNPFSNTGSVGSGHGDEILHNVHHHDDDYDDDYGDDDPNDGSHQPGRHRRRRSEGSGIMVGDCESTGSRRRSLMRHRSAQSYVEDVKGTAQSPACRDLFFFLLFVFHLIFIVYVGNMYGYKALRSHASHGRSEEVSVYYDNFVLLASLSGAFAIVLSVVLLGVMMSFAKRFVQVALIIVITLSFIWGTVGIGISPKSVVPVTGVIALALSVGYAFIVWDRTPFAGANLLTALSGIRSFPAVVVVAFLFQILAMCWSLHYAVVVCGVYDAILEGQMRLPEKLVVVVYVCLGISYCWTFQVILNTVQVITAAVIGEWWHSNEHIPWLVSRSCFRTIFYSMGSICYGSLVIVPVRIIRQLSVFVRPSNAEDTSLMCLHECIHCIQTCIMSCVDTIVHSYNTWSFTYVGMYMYGFSDAGHHATQLFEKRGWTTIVSDDLVPNVLLITSVVIGGLTGSFAHMVQKFYSLQMMSLDKPEVVAFSEGVTIGLVVACVLFGMISSSVNAVLVCFASSPWDFERCHPGLSREMRAAWREVWPGALDVGNTGTANGSNSINGARRVSLPGSTPLM